MPRQQDPQFAGLLIAYRLQHTYDDGWGIEWFRNRADAMRAYREVEKESWSVHLDMCGMPRDKDGVIAAMNAAHLHRMNWEVGPSKCIAKNTGKKRVRS